MKNATPLVRLRDFKNKCKESSKIRTLVSQMNIRRIKKFLLLLIILIIIGISAYFLRTRFRKKSVPKYYAPGSIECYHSKDDSLLDVANVNPVRDKSIFFHETSCTSAIHGKIVINSRQACAVESAAKMNPNFEVYLLYSSPGLIIDEGTESDHFLEALLSYENVKIHHSDYGSYIKNTPVEALYAENKINNSNYPLIHASDVIRYVTLWKYGGIYLDLDVVVIKSLENIPLNFAGAESTQFVAVGAIGFGRDGIGHNLSTQCLRDLLQHFDGNQWAHNGPGVITRLAESVCGTQNITRMISMKCRGNFSVYPPETFYPIYYPAWRKYFNEHDHDEVKNLAKNSYTLHLWNKLSFDTKLPLNSTASYIKFAKEFCPKVYSQCEKFF